MVSVIKGVTVTLIQKKQNGYDDFNQPIWEEVQTTVDNVLVEPAGNDAIVSELEITGKHISYILHIPKGDTNDWKDTVIILPQPWNIKVRSYGDSMIYDEDLTPLDWNKKVKVEAYE